MSDSAIYMVISSDKQTIRQCAVKEHAFELLKKLDKADWGHGPYLVYECVRIIEEKKPTRKRKK
jgi:IMP cyclohydrolase